MTCTVTDCPAELWRSTRQQTDIAASAAGWRFAWDGKPPLLSTGVALCPKCVAAGEEKNFEPARTRKP